VYEFRYESMDPFLENVKKGERISLLPASAPIRDALRL
jgi:hypothetical protein